MAPAPLKTQDEKGRRGAPPWPEALGSALQALRCRDPPSGGGIRSSLSTLFPKKKMHDAACTLGIFQHNCLKIARASAA